MYIYVYILIYIYVCICTYINTRSAEVDAGVAAGRLAHESPAHCAFNKSGSTQASPADIANCVAHTCSQVTQIGLGINKFSALTLIHNSLRWAGGGGGLAHSAGLAGCHTLSRPAHS